MLMIKIIKLLRKKQTILTNEYILLYRYNIIKYNCLRIFWL